MPPFDSLSDRDLASVLNYLVALGGSGAKKVKPITAAEISAVRKAPSLSATQVLQRRNALAAREASRGSPSPLRSWHSTATVG